MVLADEFLGDTRPKGFSVPTTKRPYNTRLTSEQLRERSRNAARVQNDPVKQAAKLVANWPEYSEDQKSTIRIMLRPVVRSGS